MKKKLNILLIILIFFVSNFIFNFQTFKDLVGTQFFGKIFISDYTMSAYVLENIFATTNKLFHPFQIDFTALGIGPSAFVFLYLIFRLLLNPTASMMLVGLVGFWLASFLMFFLLKKLKISTWVSVITSLAFSYMPFMSYQVIDQFGYIMTYFFPALYLLALIFVTSKNSKKKLALAILFGTVIGVLFYSNLYYFLMSILSFGFYVLFYFLKYKKAFMLFLKDNLKHFLLMLITFIIIVYPWVLRMKKMALLDGALNTSGFGGAQILSGDLINFITPSEYNPIYKSFVNFLTDRSTIFIKYAKFYFNSANRFVYPGIIVLVVYAYLLFFRKKIKYTVWEKISPNFFISIFFALITMGPFFKVANRWAFPLEEGLYLIVPLPFLLLHYLPQFNNIRAPQRFAPIFVFFALIVVAFVLNYIYLKLSKKKKTFFVIFLFFIFVFDQFYAIPPRVSATLPNSIYSYIKNDPQKVSVMEIPFTVRDGMEYIGFVHAVSPIEGVFTHNKQIIGGYFPRINTYIFDYYRQLSFTGYIAKIIDKGNYDPNKEKPGTLNIFSYDGDLELAKQEIDFLDIKYILLKNNEKYTTNIKKLIKKLGYTELMRDGKYDLYEREIIYKNFEAVNFGSINDSLFTAAGWSFREDEYRWAQGKLAKVFIKTNDINKQKLIFEALSFNQPQKVKVYINKKYIGEKEVSIEKGKYILDTNGKLEQGINTVYFVFSKSFVPAKLWSHDKDMRDLAVKFFNLKLE